MPGTHTERELRWGTKVSREESKPDKAELWNHPKKSPFTQNLPRPCPGSEGEPAIARWMLGWGPADHPESWSPAGGPGLSSCPPTPPPLPPQAWELGLVQDVASLRLSHTHLHPLTPITHTHTTLIPFSLGGWRELLDQPATPSEGPLCSPNLPAPPTPIPPQAAERDRFSPT